MSAILPVLTVLQALEACGVDNISMFNGETAAWSLSDEIFSNTFESCVDKNQNKLDDDFKSYSTLT